MEAGKARLLEFLTRSGGRTPECINSGEVSHPNHDFGKLPLRRMNEVRSNDWINMRHLPRVQQLAKRCPKNVDQAENDLRTFAVRAVHFWQIHTL